jgi:SAM-dependent methyltransferase
MLARVRLPWQVYRAIGRLALAPVDLLRSAVRKPTMLVPPRRRSFVYGDRFEEVGQQFLRGFVELGRLQPDEKVLDVGCGIGRMAVPLTGYLSPEAEYRGFDIVEDGVNWCREHITSRYPQFRFRVVDVHNAVYNPRGTQPPETFEFPFASEQFDFVFATSVFTHMLPPSVARYLSEMARVLRDGGRCFCTFFILNPESRSLIAQGASRVALRREGCGFVSASQREPERAIGYCEADVRELHRSSGLEVEEPIHYGTWCGRTRGLSGQDVVLSTKVSREGRIS